MKDMSARSGTYLHEDPTSVPPYFAHSFLLNLLQSRSVKLNCVVRAAMKEAEEEHQRRDRRSGQKKGERSRHNSSKTQQETKFIVMV